MLAGNPADLEGVLAEDVGFWGDGGGKVVAARRPVMGRDKVVKLLIGLKRTAPSDALEKLLVQIVEVNGEPAVLLRVGGTIEAVYTCSFDERRITGIRVVRNPAKLTYISRQLVS
jgi:RNA polymerase sigma-70 factor (ECF subfamily)